MGPRSVRSARTFDRSDTPLKLASHAISMQRISFSSARRVPHMRENSQKLGQKGLAADRFCEFFTQ